MTRHCSDCLASISRKNTSGRCRRCACAHLNRTPERRAAVSAGQIRSWETRDRSRPTNLSAWRETEEGRARHAEMNKERGRNRTAALRAWCPVEWHRRYKALRTTWGVAEAKRRVLIEMAAAELERRAALTPFERQMDAIRRGAGICERFTPPPTEYAFTLGGVSGL